MANPAAGGGRGGRIFAAARVAFAPYRATFRLTERAGDEERLTRAALEDGCTTIVAIGGDGTWSRVGAAIVTQRSDARLAPIAAGTGNDLARTLGLPAHDVARMARLAAEGGDRCIDVGRVGERYFLNVAGFGFDAAVLDAMTRAAWLGGRAAYAIAAAGQLLRYPGFAACVSTQGSSPRTYLGVFVANGRHFGGAFTIAPEASIDDGLLDVVTLGELSPLRRALVFRAATSGRHVGAPAVEVSRVRDVTVTFDAPPLVDIDGELHRAPSATVVISCVPRALRVVREP